jgi:glycosyltransferase involved in cell wall biosynthesis
VIDLALVTQDPRFGGGAVAQTEAFRSAARRLGREPELFHPRYVPLLDSIAQRAQTGRLARRIRSARSVWVVAAAGPYGDAAARSGRSYAAWIGTGLDEEWESRRPFLPRARRAALDLNAPLLRRAERRVLQRARRLYATSTSSRTGIAAAAGIDPEAIRILPIPVDTTLFHPQAHAEDEPIVLFLGRADDPRKNVRLLLDAWPLVQAELPETTLRLVGRPPVDALPNGVRAVGEVGSVAEELRKASLFVLPSLQEGFGIVVAEALASGVPVVVTPCGGPEELVRASGAGTVVADFTPGTLAAAVVDALADPGRLAEQGARGRAYVETHHSPERLQTELAAAFAELDDA